ncbi:MAG: MBOAT family O-acyltransferase [Alphaproteobacteria bacterium]
MLFNSYIFIFAFLPLAVAVYALAARSGRGSLALALLVLASLVYYGYWNPQFLWLILVSIGFNYALAGLLHEARDLGAARKAGLLLGLGAAANLGLLGYYKYAGFLIENISPLVGSQLSFEASVLPLGISFFTFQQIAYLADVRSGQAHERQILRYALFVTFFPQLIAGPIVHHREMLPQFVQPRSRRLRLDDLSIGTTIFIIGLFKKAVLADGIAEFSNPVFETAARGEPVALLDAWAGAMSYTFQLYFDFSGYSDMAVGAARMFGIKLPINFNAPYRATSIIDFWRRWHITLSRFLRDYLYIPLGGNRKGRARRHVNLMITMVLGGLWHGAGWTFILWGALHGAYLAVNHAWLHLRGKRAGGRRRPSALGLWSGRALTFVAVIFAWVIFRADNLPAALNIWAGMLGLNGVVLPQSLLGLIGPLGPALASAGAEFRYVSLTDLAVSYASLLGLLLIVWFAPTPYELLRRYRPVLPIAVGGAREVFGPSTRLGAMFAWRPTWAWAVVVAALGFVALLALASGQSEFLYYEF